MLSLLKEFFSRLDAYTFAHFGQMTSEANTQLMVIFSFLASSYFLLPANILLVLWFLVLKKDRWSAVMVAAVSVSSLLVMISLKLYFQRLRPLHPVHLAASGYSFPSGHAMSAMTFYGLLIYFTVKNVHHKIIRGMLIFVYSLLILVIGCSRIYLRVHYGSDVLAGFVFGFIWLMLSLYIFNFQHIKRSHENTI